MRGSTTKKLRRGYNAMPESFKQVVSFRGYKSMYIKDKNAGRAWEKIDVKS